MKNFDIPYTLEEIIDKCHAIYDKKTALQLFSLMRVQIARLYCDNFLNNCTMKELWYIFYMAIVHKQKWANNKKAWINL
jgi:hypothetical protein